MFYSDNDKSAKHAWANPFDDMTIGVTTFFL